MNFQLNYRSIVIFSLTIFSLSSCSQREEKSDNYKNLIIPIPTKTTFQQGETDFSGNYSLKLPPSIKNGQLLKSLLANYGITIMEGEQKKIHFIKSSELKNEEYVLETSGDNITIIAGSEAGFFYGVQTFTQLIALSGIDEVPALRIEDSPRYQWRGMHLDVSRHFISKDYLLSFIELMSSYKLNKLHLHLTDDQGWRIEIKKYPKLTAEGAWRTLDNKLDRRVLEIAEERNDPDYLLPDEHLKIIEGDTLYGGFYTQEDMKHIIAFAAERNVEIIPEIDMPGHILSALESYPHLSCTGEPGWNKFSTPICAGNEEAFEFVSDVLSEVSELFPSKYIHIGADEVEKLNWEECEKCQKRIADEGLEDEHALQGYFVKRVKSTIDELGKTMIGWDEVLDSGMPENSVMMHWRNWNPRAASKSAELNNPYVLALCHQWYLPQKLSIVYNQEPEDPNLSDDKQSLLLGVQTCSWGEQKASENLVSRANIPAMQAIAEIGWSMPENRRYDDFIVRLEEHLKLPEMQKFRFSTSFQDEMWFKTSPTGGGEVELTLFKSSSKAKVSLNSAKGNSTKTNSIILDSDNTVKATMEFKDSTYFRTFEFEFSKATGKSISANNLPPHSYGEVSKLLDGLKGGDGFNREKYIAYLGKLFDGIIDLGKTEEISEISIGMIDSDGNEEYPPAEYEILISEDGENFSKPKEISYNYQKRKGFKKAMDLIYSFEKESARYVHIISKNEVPGMESEIIKGFVFMDEIHIN